MKRFSFVTQFKIEFLLPFTGCRQQYNLCQTKISVKLHGI